MNEPPLELRLRDAAFSHLRHIQARHDGVVTGAELEEGFLFEGTRVPLYNRYRGIWRPSLLGRQGAALTIVTAPPVRGRAPAYDDQIASDSETFGYRYERGGADLWTNKAILQAMSHSLPLIYLFGVAVGLYVPIFPCYVVGNHPTEELFEISAAPLGVNALTFQGTSPDTTSARGYATAAVKVRLHQRRFRELVVSAYNERCAVCLLAHAELLDAAHILADRDERGRPEVPNGLALCKIHHAAFDTNILGIAPDLRISIRRDILEEVDGPMLRHGLQETQGQHIHVPRAVGLRPKAEYLEARFAEFRVA